MCECPLQSSVDFLFNYFQVCQLRNGAGISTGTQDSATFTYDSANGLALVYSETTDIKR